MRPAALAFWERNLYAVSLVLVAILVAANEAVRSNFLAPSHLPVLLATFAPLALAAMASMPAIISGGGGIDLSVGPLTTFANVLLVEWLLPKNLDPALDIALVLLISTGIGLVNGVMVAVFRYAAVVATLCTFFVLQGLSLRIAPTATQAPANWTSYLVTTHAGIPGGLILPLAAVCVWAVLGMIPYRQALYAVGGSDTTAFSAGVDVTATRLIAYALGGAFAGLGGIALTALVQSGDATLSTQYTLLAIAAVSLGGTPIIGGRGGITGTLLGAAVIFLLQALLPGLHVSANYTSIVYGALLIAAVVFGAVSVRSRGEVA